MLLTLRVYVVKKKTRDIIRRKLLPTYISQWDEKYFDGQGSIVGIRHRNNSYGLIPLTGLTTYQKVIIADILPNSTAAPVIVFKIASDLYFEMREP